MEVINGPIMIALFKITNRIENNEQKNIAINREWNLNAFRGEKQIRLIKESFDCWRWRLVATFRGSKLVFSTIWYEPFFIWYEPFRICALEPCLGCMIKIFLFSPILISTNPFFKSVIKSTNDIFLVWRNINYCYFYDQYWNEYW